MRRCKVLPAPSPDSQIKVLLRGIVGRWQVLMCLAARQLLDRSACPPGSWKFDGSPLGPERKEEHEDLAYGESAATVNI